MTGNLSPADNWLHHVLMKLSTETCLFQRLLLSTKYIASHDGNPSKSPYAQLGNHYTKYARGFLNLLSSGLLIQEIGCNVFTVCIIRSVESWPPLQNNMQMNPRSQSRGCPLTQESPCMISQLQVQRSWNLLYKWNYEFRSIKKIF